MKFTPIFVLFLFVFAVAQEVTRLHTGNGITAIQNQNVRASLTLSQVLTMTLQRNPQLRAGMLEIRAREAAALQAAAWPNPELEVETENFAGSGSWGGFKASETTVSVRQRIELGGKRGKRVRLAELDVEQATREYEWQKLDIVARVIIAFYDVLIAQKKVALNREMLTLAESFKDHIEKRVRAGRLSPAELLRATVDVTEAQVVLQRSRKRLQVVRKKLAAFWDAREPRFAKVDGDLERFVPLPEFELLRKYLQDNPALLRFKTAQKKQQIVRALVRAGRIPDPLVRVGWRRFHESGDRAIVAGISLLLPVLNRTREAEKEVLLRSAKITRDEKTYRLELENALFDLYRQLQAAFGAVQALKGTIIPQAQQAFTIIDVGYRQGKFGFLDVLEARRTLFVSRDAYLQKLNAYQKLKAQIERLVGRSLAEIR